MKIEIKDNKVVEVVRLERKSSEWFEDVARLRAQADRIEIKAQAIELLEVELIPETKEVK